jgi:hypothetical protein
MRVFLKPITREASLKYWMKFSRPTNSQSKSVHRVMEKKNETIVGMIKKIVKMTAIGITRA